MRAASGKPTVTAQPPQTALATTAARHRRPVVQADGGRSCRKLPSGRRSHDIASCELPPQCLRQADGGRGRSELPSRRRPHETAPGVQVRLVVRREKLPSLPACTCVDEFRDAMPLGSFSPSPSSFDSVLVTSLANTSSFSIMNFPGHDQDQQAALFFSFQL